MKGYSKVNKTLEYTDKVWVVSLINTGKGVNQIFGGHCKIIVEGMRKNPNTTFTERFIAEYHIMEAEHIAKSSWIPQCMRNTQAKYSVLYTERNQYVDGKIEQYENSSSQSWHASPLAIKKMIDDIKEEENKIKNLGEHNTENTFEYFGKWSYFSVKSGHNCSTWAEEKLEIAGVGNGKIATDSSKAAPVFHTKCLIS